MRDLGAPTSNLESLIQLLEPAWHSLTASMLGALLVLVLALPVAVLVVRRPGRLSRIFENFTYVTFALPGIVIALAFVFFGAGYAPFFYQTLPLLLIAYVVLFVPQAVGAERTALLQVSSSLEEAGRSLGKRPLAVFRHITLPLVKPGLNCRRWSGFSDLYERAASYPHPQPDCLFHPFDSDLG